MEERKSGRGRIVRAGVSGNLAGSVGAWVSHWELGWDSESLVGQWEIGWVRSDLCGTVRARVG